MKNFSLQSPLSVSALIILIAQGCVYHSLPDPANCRANPSVNVELVALQDSDCGSQNGSFEVMASGGSGVYRYQLGDGEIQSGNSFANLAAGTYTVTVFDDLDCNSSLDVSIQNVNGVNLQATATEAGCKTSNGMVTAAAAGGVEPYSFKVTGRDFQSASTFENLPAGEYLVTVRDATNCESSQPARVSSGISFSGSVSTIIQTKCAISGCHNGSQFPDLRTFENIKSNAANIKNLTGNRSMPATGSLSQTQIDQIACWVDDGAPNN